MAGGTGSRLWPLTSVINKHLLPIHDKPMIYYPLTSMMFAGVTDIAIVSSPIHLNQFRTLLGDGSQWGLRLEYFPQKNPGGIAQSFSIAREFCKEEPVCLALGDNVLFGTGLGRSINSNFDNQGAQIFAYPVSNPSSFGIVDLDESGHPQSIVEKPKVTSSNLAIPGFYFFDSTVWNKAEQLKPSPRNELEITDVLKHYLTDGSLKVVQLERGTVWLDAGTIENLMSASEFVRVIELRQGFKLGCPEEIALRLGLIDQGDFRRLVSRIPQSEYKDYLNQLT